MPFAPQVLYREFPFVGVPAGAWVAQDEPNGFLKVFCCTYKFVNSAAKADVTVGAHVRVRVSPPKRRRRVGIPHGLELGLHRKHAHEGINVS